VNKVLYEIIIPLYSNGMIDKDVIFGLVKGFSKVGGAIKFLPLLSSAETEEENNFVRFLFYAPAKSILNWQEQIRSYGITVERVKEKEV